MLLLPAKHSPAYMYIYTLSRLSAHMVNRLLRENRKSIPNLSGKKLFKNVTLRILNFILVSY